MLLLEKRMDTLFYIKAEMTYTQYSLSFAGTNIDNLILIIIFSRVY